MRVLIGIQARSNSTRLPGKVYKKIGPKSVLEWCYERAQLGAINSHGIKTEVAVIGPRKDSKLWKFCLDKGIKYFRRTCAVEDDLTQRYWDALKYYCCSNLVRITSDCPAINPRLIKNAILNLSQYDYVTTTYQRTYPEGQDIQGIGKAAFAWYRDQLREEHLFYDLEHNYKTREEFEKLFKFHSMLNQDTLITNPYIQNSIDTQEDLERMRRAYERVA